MVLNAKFWSFPIHTYQKQPFLMIILAVRGRGKNLVIDRNSIVKNENLKILTKTHVIYLKRKLRTCKMQIQVEKVWFVTKKMEKINFEKKNFKGGTLWSRNGWKKKFRFSNFQNIFLKNGFNGTWQILIETKSWNLSSFRASTEKSLEIICQGGSVTPPPPPRVE